MLWLCLHFRDLPVECFSSGEDDAQPLFVSEAGRVIGINRAARRLGIRPGMLPTAARALSESGVHRVRDPHREHQTLEQLATWALQFTPRVSLQPPEALLLEVAGSLRYFQGLEPLRRQVSTGLEQRGHRAATGIAPTPTAAWMLARAGDSTPVTTREALTERLAPLPLQALPLDRPVRDALEGLGCDNVAAVRSLPSDGATRRLGRPLLETLQRAHGERPDPRRNWQPPGQFEAHLDCPEAIVTVDGLHPLVQQLLEGLCRHLRERDTAVMRMWFMLRHRDGPPTCLPVGVMSPTRDAGHLKWLAERRLERLELTTDVIAVTLRAGRFHATGAANGAFDLLDTDDRSRQDADWQTLIETFDSRLGEERVHMITPVAEHRPERAWAYQRPEKADPATPLPRSDARPAWLLECPLPLGSRQGRPHYHNAPLVLEAGPERIETGWWDGLDVTRDYYQARTAAGHRIWIFRNRRGQRDWYVHGIFA